MLTSKESISLHVLVFSAHGSFLREHIQRNTCTPPLPTHLQAVYPSTQKGLQGMDPLHAQLDRAGDLVPGGQVHEARAATVQREPTHVLPLVLFLNEFIENRLT